MWTLVTTSMFYHKHSCTKSMLKVKESLSTAWGVCVILNMLPSWALAITAHYMINDQQLFVQTREVHRSHTGPNYSCILVLSVCFRLIWKYLVVAEDVLCQRAHVNYCGDQTCWHDSPPDSEAPLCGCVDYTCPSWYFLPLLVFANDRIFGALW